MTNDRDKQIAELNEKVYIALAIIDEKMADMDTHVYYEEYTAIRTTINELDAENKELRKRLEMDFVYDMDGKKVPAPDCMPDGISCRDETIKGLYKNIDSLRAKNKKLREEKDGAYTERNLLVAALSKVFPSHLEQHPKEDTAWDDDWRTIIFIALPTGQASWHIHDSEIRSFEHLENKAGSSWDGHTTEEKYKRLQALENKESE